MTDEPTTENLPAITDETLRRAGLPTMMEMSPGLAIFFDDAIYARCKQIATVMANGGSMTPKHLRGKPEACFSVVSMSINWRMNPMQVARSTYETPGGNIGYEGKLIQAILELSGKIDGQIRFTHEGDWSKVRRKFKMETGKSGGEYPTPTWTPEDAEGLFVKVSACLKGEEVDRTLDVYLDTCWPLNSPLWATDPRRQICYFGVRAFANLATPTLLFGIPFDVDPAGLSDMVDITPARPQASEFARSPEKDNPDLGDWTAKANFANTIGELATVRKDGLAALSQPLHARFEETCDNRGRQITAGEPDQVQVEGDQNHQDADQETPQDDKQEGAVEAPFKRGTRLLDGLTVPGDIIELHASIAEELKGKKDKDLWRGTCEAKWKEVGGTGKMPKAVG
jgi:hypothetical protein